MECGSTNVVADTDDDLLERFQATSDPRLLDDLLGRYLVPMRNLMFQMVGNEADADDLTQETIVKAYRGLHRFEGRCKFSTWIYRIGMNTARGFLRQRCRHPVQPLEPYLEPAAPKQHRPDWRITCHELQRHVQMALDLLSPHLRSALVLTVLQDLSAKEAAAIENCPAATIYWRVFQARRQLRKTLAEFLD